jgi:predicted helicase
LKFTPITPSKDYSWINIIENDNDWDNFIPIASKLNKRKRTLNFVNTIFKDFYIGVVSARDDWITDLSKENLNRKMKFFTDVYHSHSPNSLTQDTIIKWSRNLRRNLSRGCIEPFDSSRIKPLLYRPYCKTNYYDSEVFVNDRAIAKENSLINNLILCFTAPGNQKPFNTLVTNLIPDFHLNGDTQCLPLYHNQNGEAIENITDWALDLFRQQYDDENIEKINIFHYVYAVLHHPSYRKMYEQNIKREFPRIPFYKDFWQWSGWGKSLMDIHLNFEKANPYDLQREDKDPQKVRTRIKCLLRARKETGTIEIDTLTTLRCIPPEVWEYRLGTYSALEWILERYKEHDPKDQTIKDNFYTYRFSNYKEQVIEFIRRVCKISIETMKIIKSMPN